MGPDCVRDGYHSGGCPDTHLRPRPAAIERPRRDHDSCRHGGHDADGRQLWKNGIPLPNGGIRIHLRRSQYKSAPRLHDGLGHVSRLPHYPADEHDNPRSRHPAVDLSSSLGAPHPFHCSGLRDRPADDVVEPARHSRHSPRQSSPADFLRLFGDCLHDTGRPPRVPSLWLGRGLLRSTTL